MGLNGLLAKAHKAFCANPQAADQDIRLNGWSQKPNQLEAVFAYIVVPLLGFNI